MIFFAQIWYALVHCVGLLEHAFETYHKFLSNSEKWLKLVCICRSYRKIKTGVPLFVPPCTACRRSVGKLGTSEVSDLTRSELTINQNMYGTMRRE